VGVVDDIGRTLSRVVVPTHVEQGPESTAQRIGEAVHSAIHEAGLQMSAVARAGLGSPGTLDLRAGKMVNPVNFPGFEDFSIRDRVAEVCGLNVAFANDASAAAYGEFWVGTGKNFHSMILLTLGTGVGCGVIIGDLIIEGEHGFGTECGHIIIDCTENARKCSCGQMGHLEAYASATGVVNRARDAIAEGRKTSLARRIEAGEELTPLLVAQEAEAGDELARFIALDTARYLAVGIVSLVHTIDPDGVLLGGAMTFGMHKSPLGKEFLQRVTDEFRARTFPLLAQTTVIEYASLGNDAGYLGAAGLARLEQRKSM
jgi:glucokinase